MSITKEEFENLAKECEFDFYGVLDAAKLDFRDEVRDMCEAGRCKAYGKNWSCPPACGTIEDSKREAAKYKYGIILQTMAKLEDDFDVEGMFEAEKLQKERFFKIVDKLREKDVDILPMGSGACTVCKTCAYPDEPCRFPKKKITSMEAYGLVVSDSCLLAGVDYYHGPQTIAYSGCILFNTTK